MPNKQTFADPFGQKHRGVDFGFSGQRATKAATPPRENYAFSAFSTGPKEFSERTNPLLGDAPGPPPPGFVRATTSGSEWYVYWALAKISGSPKGADVRNPPFYGSRDGELWRYQYPYAGGRHLPGGAVVDFVWMPFNNSILLRLQTEHFHGRR